jgi:hypothetical protein
MQFTYLLIDFFTVIICFIFSFHPKINFYRHFGAFIKSSLIVGFVFIVWDILFTKAGVWWFNYDYLIGAKIAELPVEEILFFICIPFSCIFTYFCLTKFLPMDWEVQRDKLFVMVSIVVYGLLAIYFYEKIYTFITFLTLTISLIILYFVLGVRWMGKAFVVYLILLPGFLVVNGILTGTGLEKPIVNYNPENFIGFRILTIPVEDFFYGFELIIWNLFFFKKFKRNELEEAYLEK